MGDKYVHQIECDWFATSENGEEYCTFTLGETSGLKDIKYNSCFVEGDRHYADLYFEDGRIVRTFNLSRVIWKPINKSFDK